MSPIRVSVSRNSFGVRQKKTSRVNVSSRIGVAMARRLSDLQDVDLQGLRDKYVLMYEESQEKWLAKNPDEVLSASAVTEQTQPGLPQDFLDFLRQNLETQAADELFQQLSERLDNLELGDLVNVNDDDRRDKYLIMFNELLNEYRAVNPDEVLIASVEEPEQPGLPDELLDELDVELDNRIDFDGGEY